MTCKNKTTEHLDTCGLRCPLPLLRTKQKLSKMPSGQILEVVATDAGSWRDIPTYIDSSRHRLLQQLKLDSGRYVYRIERGDD